MNYRSIALAFGVLGTLLVVSPTDAQVRAGNRFAPAARPGAMPQRSLEGRIVPAHRMHHRFSAYGPYYYPYYPYDYDEGTAEPPSPPQRFSAEPSTPAAPLANVKPAESMVVELRGDRWVRLTSSGPLEVGARPASPQPSGSVIEASEPVAKPLAAFSQTPSAAPPLPPATLVFRDGHQEQAAKYTIVGSTIYLKSDYWANGSWTRKILVADLDVPATLKLNHDRGANFSLPSRPSEVILRP